jgi:hypothetical protein
MLLNSAGVQRLKAQYIISPAFPLSLFIYSKKLMLSKVLLFPMFHASLKELDMLDAYVMNY